MNFTEAYSTIIFDLKDEQQEVLIALLEQAGFEAFEQEPEKLTAYILSAALTDDVLTYVTDDLNVWYDTFKIQELPQKNWNEAWESSFQPIVVRDFCGVRASFHQPLTNVQYELVIDPKMAFGTGHHATTWMMLDHMSQIPMEGKHVLDFGAGTGILAILAAQMGAKSIDAVEIDPVAVDNCKNNVILNQQPHIKSIEGSITSVPNGPYDLILANINRNVIVESLPELIQLLKKGGEIVFSGILASDEHLIKEKFSLTELIWEKKVQKDDWISILLKK